MNKLIKKIKETMDLLIDIIILLWNAAYGYFIAAIILNLLIGLIMPFQVMVWKKVIDNLAEIVRETIAECLRNISVVQAQADPTTEILSEEENELMDSLDMFLGE